MMSLWDRTILVDRDVVLGTTVPGVSHGFILVLEEPANKLAIELKSHVRRRSSCATDLGHDTVNADRVPFDSRSTPLGFNMRKRRTFEAEINGPRRLLLCGSSSIMPSTIPGLLRVGIHQAFVIGDARMALDPLGRRVVDWFYARCGIPVGIVDGYDSPCCGCDKLTAYDDEWK